MPEYDSTICYAEVQGYPAYRVGSDGSVWSCWKRGCTPKTTDHWKRLNPRSQPSGHLAITLCPGRFKVLVHRLVLEVFVGPCPEGMEACHFPDRNPTNNTLENLRWGTRQSNRDDMVIHGTTNRTLTNETVKAIRAEYLSRSECETKKHIITDLANRHRKSCSCIEAIVYRRNYKAVS